jgi:hypothetical protein
MTVLYFAFLENLFEGKALAFLPISLPIFFSSSIFLLSSSDGSFETLPSDYSMID